MAIEIEIQIVDLRRDDLFCLDQISASEKARADRFASPLLARRFTSSRVALRRSLSQRLGRLQPRQVSLTVGPHGKPRLGPGAPDCDLQFNMARSKDTALIAFAQGVEIGIDIEGANRLFEDSALEERVLSPAERLTLRHLSDAERALYFGRYWVRKEAVLKAIGTGLLWPPALVDTSTLGACSQGSLILNGLGGVKRKVWWHDIPLAGFDGIGAVAFSKPRGLRAGDLNEEASAELKVITG